MGMAMTAGADGVEIEPDPEVVGEFADAWSTLAVARENAFLTAEWFAAWRRHYADGARPVVGVARSPEGELEGVLPLVLEGRTVRFAGSGLGDRFGPAAAAEKEAEVAAALGGALRGIRGMWSSLVLENVDPEARWWRELSRAAGCGETPILGRGAPLPAIRIGSRGWEEYLATRSRNLRSQLGRRRRALERSHDVHVRWSDEERVEEDMTTLFSLHRARWSTRKGGSSMTQRAVAFHTDFAKLAARRGWLRLCFLEVDREPVAGWYGWRIGERFAYYQAGFDPKWADRSVGLVLFAETIRAAFEEGATTYDMLLGDEHFKQRFADDADAVRTVVIAPRWRPARLIARAEARARSASQALPQGLRESAKGSARGLLDRLPMARRR